MTMMNFHLCPCKFLSTPHVAFNTMLKMTGIEIQLLPEIDMINSMKAGMRGGVASTMHRYAEANLPNEPGYDPEKPRAEILGSATRSLVHCRWDTKDGSVIERWIASIYQTSHIIVA